MSTGIDFQSIFDIQRNYLANLNVLKDTNVVFQEYKKLGGDLDTLYNSYSTTNPSSNETLTHQQQMIDILDREQSRLENKKTGIENAYNTQKRLIELNESYRQKNAEYINILIVVIITILLYLALILISRYIPFIPSIVINLLIAILFASSIIIISIIISKITSRDSMNFQKKIFVPPYIQTGNVYGSGVSFNPSNAGLPVYCVGENCCGNGTEWNPTFGNCSIKPVSLNPFTLISESRNEAIPYVPFEYDSYAKV
jgi:hypothetical protein